MPDLSLRCERRPRPPGSVGGEGPPSHGGASEGGPSFVGGARGVGFHPQAAPMSEGPSLAACTADDPPPAVRAADDPMHQRHARRWLRRRPKRGRKVEMAVGERDAGEERGDGRREEGRWRWRPEGGRRRPA